MVSCCAFATVWQKRIEFLYELASLHSSSGTAEFSVSFLQISAKSVRTITSISFLDSNVVMAVSKAKASSATALTKRIIRAE